MVDLPMFVPLGSCNIFMVLPLVLTMLGSVEVQHTTFPPPTFSPNVRLCIVPCFGLLGCVLACWGAWGGTGPNCWFLARSLNAKGKSPRVGQIGVNRFFRRNDLKLLVIPKGQSLWQDCTEILELSCSAVEDVDTSALLVRFMMTEIKECLWNHLEGAAVIWMNAARKWTIPLLLQSKCNRVSLDMGMQHTVCIHKCSQQSITISFLFLRWSQSNCSRCRCRRCAHCLELNCDKC